MNIKVHTDFGDNVCEGFIVIPKVFDGCCCCCCCFGGNGAVECRAGVGGG